MDKVFGYIVTVALSRGCFVSTQYTHVSGNNRTCITVITVIKETLTGIFENKWPFGLEFQCNLLTKIANEKSAVKTIKCIDFQDLKSR